MFAIITKYVTEHKLNKEMSLEELRSHELVLLKLLIDVMKRKKSHQHFQDEYDFSKKQISILIPLKELGE